MARSKRQWAKLIHATTLLRDVDLRQTPNLDRYSTKETYLPNLKSLGLVPLKREFSSISPSATLLGSRFSQNPLLANLCSPKEIFPDERNTPSETELSGVGAPKVVPGCVSVCQVIYSQFGLAIHQNDHQARRRFVEWAQNEIAVVQDFHKRILFSDEAHFWLNGYVNKQNCRIWSEANPQVYVETPLHPEKLTVWCALWAGGILLQKR
ncbi:putative transposase [Trichonephila clavipes]|nr:putative transposase [Trichonephila clavipes]